MPGVLTEDTFVEVPEGGVAVGVVGDDPGPAVVAAAASSPLGEPIEPRAPRCAGNFRRRHRDFPLVL